jgi:hypothetical protein
MGSADEGYAVAGLERYLPIAGNDTSDLLLLVPRFNSGQALRGNDRGT